MSEKIPLLQIGRTDILRALDAAGDLLAALKKCRSAIDGLMIDTDIDGDDNPAMQALQAASKAIAAAKAAGIKVKR